MFIERPLTSLPTNLAARFLETLAVPKLSVTDPDLMTLGFQKVAVSWTPAPPAAFEPIGLRKTMFLSLQLAQAA